MRILITTLLLCTTPVYSMSRIVDWWYPNAEKGRQIIDAYPAEYGRDANLRLAMQIPNRQDRVSAIDCSLNLSGDVHKARSTYGNDISYASKDCLLAVLACSCIPLGYLASRYAYLQCKKYCKKKELRRKKDADCYEVIKTLRTEQLLLNCRIPEVLSAHITSFLPENNKHRLLSRLNGIRRGYQDNVKQVEEDSYALYDNARCDLFSAKQEHRDTLEKIGQRIKEGKMSQWTRVLDNAVARYGILILVGVGGLFSIQDASTILRCRSNVYTNHTQLHALLNKHNIQPSF